MTLRRVMMGLAALVSLGTPLSGRAEEGFWTFDHFPSETVRERYASAPDQAWLDHVRLGAVRLGAGSASLASSEGLVLTNQHVIEDCVKDVSGAGSDLLATGFLAARQSDEKRCPGLQAAILQSIEDVTKRLRAVIDRSPPADLSRLFYAEIDRIEGDACRTKENAECDVVSFYGGGQYKLYTYRTYDDVRLVFAPEFQTATFGGDPDNFNFPRFAFDMALVRLYAGGHPATTPDRLRWDPAGPRAGDLVYAAGHPRSTSRSETASELETERDLPNASQFVRAELRGRLLQLMAQGAAQRRIGRIALQVQENQFKYYYGGERALINPAIMAAKRAEEAEVRAFLAAYPDVTADVGDPWADISRAQATYRSIFLEYEFLEDHAGSISDLFDYARRLVRAANAGARPDPASPPAWVIERSAIEPAVERIALELWLGKTREYLTVDHPAVRRMLGRELPEGLAARLVRGTRLANPAVRRALWAGGKPAIAASSDPLIRFASAIEADAQAIGERYRNEVAGPMANAANAVGKGPLRGAGRPHRARRHIHAAPVLWNGCGLGRFGRSQGRSLHDIRRALRPCHRHRAIRPGAEMGGRADAPRSGDAVQRCDDGGLRRRQFRFPAHRCGRAAGRTDLRLEHPCARMAKRL